MPFATTTTTTTPPQSLTSSSKPSLGQAPGPSHVKVLHVLPTYGLNKQALCSLITFSLEAMWLTFSFCSLPLLSLPAQPQLSLHRPAASLFFSLGACPTFPLTLHQPSPQASEFLHQNTHCRNYPLEQFIIIIIIIIKPVPRDSVCKCVGGGAV